MRLPGSSLRMTCWGDFQQVLYREIEAKTIAGREWHSHLPAIERACIRVTTASQIDTVVLQMRAGR